MTDEDNLAFFVSDDHVSDPNFKTADGTSRSFVDMPGEDDRGHGSMIERMARAIYEQYGSFISDCEFPEREPVFVANVWEDAPDQARAFAIHQARAVLTAMREPSVAMTQTIATIIHREADDAGPQHEFRTAEFFEDAVEAWRAAINVAMDE